MLTDFIAGAGAVLAVSLAAACVVAPDSVRDLARFAVGALALPVVVLAELAARTHIAGRHMPYSVLARFIQHRTLRSGRALVLYRLNGGLILIRTVASDKARASAAGGVTTASGTGRVTR